MYIHPLTYLNAFLLNIVKIIHFIHMQTRDRKKKLTRSTRHYLSHKNPQIL